MNRTNGRLDTAVLARRTDPSAANREARLGFARDHVAHFGAEQATEPIERTTEGPTSQAKQDLWQPAITAGTRILVADEQGIYIVAGENSDGSLTCYPAGEPDAATRPVRPEWCVPAERQGRDGKVSRVRTVPLSARRARALWRAQHGFRSFDHLHRVPAGESSSPVSDAAI